MGWSGLRRGGGEMNVLVVYESFSLPDSLAPPTTRRFLSHQADTLV
jgi:hypothetical protein